jgi:hypothetical protein
MYHHNN